MIYQNERMSDQVVEIMFKWLHTNIVRFSGDKKKEEIVTWAPVTFVYYFGMKMVFISDPDVYEAI